jgi:hypothetical protein
MVAGEVVSHPSEPLESRAAARDLVDHFEQTLAKLHFVLIAAAFGVEKTPRDVGECSQPRPV